MPNFVRSKIKKPVFLVLHSPFFNQKSISLHVATKSMVMPTALKSIVALTTKCDFLFGIGLVQLDLRIIFFYFIDTNGRQPLSSFVFG